MNKKYRIISLLIGVLIVISAFFYLFNKPVFFEYLSNISYLHLLLILSLWFFIYLLTGLKFKYIYLQYHNALHFSEWYGMTMVGSMTNYLLPQSGLAVRAGYFKFKKEIPVKIFFQIQILDYIYFFLTSCIIGMAILFLIDFDSDLKYTLFLFFLIVLLLCGLTFIKLDNIRLKYKYICKIIDFIKSLQSFNNFNNARRIVILNITKVLLISILYLFSFSIAGVKIDYMMAAIIGIVINILIFFPITPGNMGIQELLVAFLSESTDLGYDNGLFAALIIRSTNLLFVFVNGIIFSKYFMIKKNI